MLDDLNTTLIEALTQNARTPLNHIARQLNISESTLRKRLQKLEEHGIIKQYSLVVDHAKLGYSHLALVGVDADPERFLHVSTSLKKIKEATFVASSQGDHMFMLKVLAADTDHLQHICDSIRSIHGVTRICPAIIKDTIKGTL